MHYKISCIVPFYNESTRIASTLSTLCETKYIDEILAVDDGSTDHPHLNIKKYKNTVIFLKNKTNKGKSHAVYYGLQKSQGNIIFLIDADLKDLRSEEIDAACKQMIDTSSIDMIILKSTQGTLITRLCRQDIVLSGARFLRKNDLYEVYKNKPQRYQLETAINTYMKNHNKVCYFSPFSAYNTLRAEKTGTIESLKGLFFLLKDVYSYNGYIPYLWQLCTFCHKNLTQSHSKSYSLQKPLS